MRTLSSTLSTAQKEISSPPIWKVVLSRAAVTTRGYDQTRLWKISQTETPSGDTVALILNNSDGALTSLDFEHYQAVISYGYNTGVSRTAWATGTVYAVDDIRVPTTANGYQYRCSVAGTSHATTEPTWTTSLGVNNTDNTVTWEMDGNSGEEYSRTAPLRVRVQELHSGRGILKVILRPEGILDQLSEDKAESVYTQTSGDTQTVKTLITAVTNVTLSPYTNYSSYTATYDSEDSLIDSFIPKDFFSAQMNETRLNKIQELLDFTGEKMRAQNDGKLHFLDPVTTGTTYDYEYKFNVSGDHNFWGKSIRIRFINPNQEIVKSHPDHEAPQYSGSATSATSYALAPKTHTTYARLASNAQAASIAAAMIERYELDDERGFVTVPMNVGQELWDYVKVTDSRQNDTRVGNVQFIKREVEIHRDGRPLTWTMMLSFGKVTALSLMANMLTAGTSGDAARLSNEDIQAQINALYDMIKELYDNDNTLVTIIEGIVGDAVFRKLTVTEREIIPHWS